MRSSTGIEPIVYGDFNCPFSALASARVGRLERLGRASIDWRAVEHAPDIPRTGRPVVGALRIALLRELDMIRSLLTEEESDRFALPAVQPNTHLAAAAYASAPAPERPIMRARLFAAHWIDGRDLADRHALAHLGVPHADESTAARWRDDWLALGEPVVPVMVLPDGAMFQGLEALGRLAQLAGDPTGAAGDDVTRTDARRDERIIDVADLGGESPCFAHLFDDTFD